MNNFKVGDKVTWESVAGKTITREGFVIEVVAAGTYPSTMPPFHKGRQLAKRDHESYVVESFTRGRKDRLWPMIWKLSHVAKPTAARPGNAANFGYVDPASQETDFVILLDSSGSMQSHRDGAIRMFNAEVEAIKDAAARTGIKEPRISLYTFGGVVRRVFYRESVARLQSFDRYSYNPEGGTPMLDCIGDAVTDLHKELDVISNQNLSVVLHMISDGEECTSNRYRVSQIRDLINATTLTGRWTHAFMLPVTYKAKFLKNFPIIPAENIMEWQQTERGMKEATDKTAAAINTYSTSKAAGVMSVSNFYQPDLSGITDADLNKLRDLSREFKVYEVAQELDIKSYVEGKTRGAYVIGSVYYQLSKTEKVQGSKQVLLRDRFTHRIYGGQDARRLIGLPFGKDVKVEPGNHSKFDIFVKSTSSNRKLVRGTKILHDFNQRVDDVSTWDHTVVGSNQVRA